MPKPKSNDPAKNAAANAALKAFDPEAVKASKQPPAPRTTLEVHSTIPLDKSLECLKAHKKRKPKIQKEGATKDESSNHGSPNGPGEPNPAHAGESSGPRRKWKLVLPLDYFRRDGGAGE